MSHRIIIDNNAKVVNKETWFEIQHQAVQLANKDGVHHVEVHLEHHYDQDNSIDQ